MTKIRENLIPSFFILTFLIAWLIWIPIGLFAPEYFIIAVIPGAWAPTLAALVLTGLSEGKAGLREFVTRLLRWRVGLGWWGVVLFSMAAILGVSIGIDVALGGSWPQIVFPGGAPVAAWPVVIPILFVMNIFVGGPLAEDAGWRGYILPKLGSRIGPLNASLIIGGVWAIWHLPFYWFPEGLSAVGGVPFGWFALLTMAWGVLFAWVFVNTHESILMPVLYHAAINTTLGSTDALGFVRSDGDVQLLVIVTIVMWLVVLGIVATHGQSLRRRQSELKQSAMADAPK